MNTLSIISHLYSILSFFLSLSLWPSCLTLSNGSLQLRAGTSLLLTESTSLVPRVRCRSVWITLHLATISIGLNLSGGICYPDTTTP